MSELEGKLIASFERSFLTLSSDDCPIVSVPFSEDFNVREFMSFLNDSENVLRLTIDGIKSLQNLPVLEVYLNSPEADNRAFRLGTMAMYGIGNFSRSGLGVTSSMEVRSIFSTALSRRDWSDEAFQLTFKLKRSNDTTFDLSIDRIELRCFPKR